MKLSSTRYSQENFAEKLNLNLSAVSKNIPTPPKILIAGCGTGQHSLQTASRFKGSTVTAIDLSLSSLAYAKRKTEELGVKNIDYMQADILSVAKLKKTFDIVESVGVLHHMDDPIAGWSSLVECLDKHGLMKIGLYSELARQDIVKLRGLIAEHRVSSTREGMIRFRQNLIDGNKFYNNVQDSVDFYTTSTLRDLIFHIKEHRFTIPLISSTLKKLGLEFVGFEFKSKHVPALFRSIYPDNDSFYDLEKWHEFEEQYQSAFSNLYQFWVQKL